MNPEEIIDGMEVEIAVRLNTPWLLRFPVGTIGKVKIIGKPYFTVHANINGKCDFWYYMASEVKIPDYIPDPTTGNGPKTDLKIKAV